MKRELRNRLLPSLHTTALRLLDETSRIPAERKASLEALAAYVTGRLRAASPARLIFICTHNSRRSHLAQLWAQAAAYAASIEGIECFSGGTEATAFNPRAVNALREAGFAITVAAKMDGAARAQEPASTADNPLYDVRFADEAPVVKACSKLYDDPFNPSSSFAAVMTCSEADRACPVVPGADARFPMRYEDPKSSDDSDAEQVVYLERCLEIGREMLYLMQCVDD